MYEVVGWDAKCPPNRTISCVNYTDRTNYTLVGWNVACTPPLPIVKISNVTSNSTTSIMIKPNETTV